MTTDWKSVDWTTFVHPHNAYRLEFPAHWEHRVEQDGETCGFGPRDRDNVGLWISILPASVDTDRLSEDLPRFFAHAMQKAEAANIREDVTLHHHGLKADMTSPEQGGQYWMIAGGDLVLFGSSQVPPAERDQWNPAFERVMASLVINRDDELLMRKITFEALELLRERHPDQEYEADEKGIRGKNHVLFLYNLWREVLAAPHRLEELVRTYVEAVNPTSHPDLGREEWIDVEDRILPVLKHESYLKTEGPTRHIHTVDWLADVVICYAIRSERSFRFITGWDLDRWEVDPDRLHATAIENLVELSFPERLEGSRQPGGGRLILVTPCDSFGASRLLHPELHDVFRGALGSPFLAAVPSRDTLVLFTNKRSVKKKLLPTIRKDHDKSSYAITPRIFLVTPDGIALAGAG
ncbi:MAG TPA: DUF1444 family protein [Planctomycetaceae bacterium]|nr:DUF1444 family protein [Planctomycetaceae bacterium]